MTARQADRAVPKTGFKAAAAKAPIRRAHRTYSDFMLIAGGLALGLGCALFPWYVFTHQEQFGIRPIKMDPSLAGGASNRTILPAFVKRLNSDRERAATELDFAPTGTLPDRQPAADELPSAEDQPYPAAPVQMQLVHVANGMAMVEDGTGLWIVEKGSILPDNSRVVSIEQREGRWVLVTSEQRVLEAAQN